MSAIFARLLPSRQAATRYVPLAAEVGHNILRRPVRGAAVATHHEVPRRPLHSSTPLHRGELDITKTETASGLAAEVRAKLGLIPEIHGSPGNPPPGVEYNPNPFACLSNTQLLRNTLVHMGLAHPKADNLVAIAQQLLKIPGLSWGTIKVFEKSILPVFFGGKSSDEMRHTVEGNWKQGWRTLVDYAPEGPDTDYQSVLDDLEQQVTPMVVELAAKAKEKGQPRLAPALVLKGSAILPPDLMLRLANIYPDGTPQEELSNPPMRVEDNKLYREIKSQLRRTLAPQNKDGVDVPITSQGVEVVMDAELTWQNPVILRLVSDLSRGLGIPITITLQTYLIDPVSEETRMHINSHGRPKVVGGAYPNIESGVAKAIGGRNPIVNSKSAADENFIHWARHYLDTIKITSLICTHSSERTASVLAQWKDMAPYVELATLQGMVSLFEAGMLDDKSGKRSENFNPAGLRTIYTPFVFRTEDGLEYGLRRANKMDLGPQAKAQVIAHNAEMWRRFEHGFPKLAAFISGNPK